MACAMSLLDKPKRIQSQGDALEGNSLFRLQRPGEAPVVCLLQDAAVQEGINAEGFGSLALLAESRKVEKGLYFKCEI